MSSPADFARHTITTTGQCNALEHDIALFEKPDPDLEVISKVPLTGMRSDVGALPERHGKPIFGLT